MAGPMIHHLVEGSFERVLGDLAYLHRMTQERLNRATSAPVLVLPGAAGTRERVEIPLDAALMNSLAVTASLLVRGKNMGPWDGARVRIEIDPALQGARIAVSTYPADAVPCCPSLAKHEWHLAREQQAGPDAANVGLVASGR